MDKENIRTIEEMLRILNTANYHAVIATRKTERALIELKEISGVVKKEIDKLEDLLEDSE